jgi:hypothetical protein
MMISVILTRMVPFWETGNWFRRSVEILILHQAMEGATDDP